MKTAIIIANAVISLSLAIIGLIRMMLRDPLLGRGYEWSTLMWIVGIVTLFLIPLEICVLKSGKAGRTPPRIQANTRGRAETEIAF